MDRAQGMENRDLLQAAVTSCGCSAWRAVAAKLLEQRLDKACRMGNE